jgi:hypothetical protein
LFGDFFLVFRSGDEQGRLAEGAVEHLNERFDGSITEHAGRYSLFERDSQHGDGVAIFDDAEALPAQDRWGVEQGDALDAWVSGRFEEGAKATGIAYTQVFVAIHPDKLAGLVLTPGDVVWNFLPLPIKWMRALSSQLPGGITAIASV